MKNGNAIFLKRKRQKKVKLMERLRGCQLNDLGRKTPVSLFNIKRKALCPDGESNITLYPDGNTGKKCYASVRENAREKKMVYLGKKRRETPRWRKNSGKLYRWTLIGQGREN